MNGKSDAQLHKDVVDELEFEPSLDAGKIAVAVAEGIVTLSGSVTNYFEKWAAESAVKRVQGVEGVAEELTVNPFPSPERTDTDIAEAARRALDWDAVVSEKHIRIEVERGWVRLEGQLDWHYERQHAHDAVAHLRGVKGVRNLITLKPLVTSEDVRARIESAFERNANLDASRVRVEVDGSNITLRGHLPTWAERDSATRAAWNVGGVTSVTNQIVVGT